MIMFALIITMLVIGGTSAFILVLDYEESMPKWLEGTLAVLFLVGVPGGIVVAIVSILTWMWMLALS